ncbi:TPA: hypothetical protein HA239_00450 [Candidatus Woesearchaeota archaeon]|nr:hypothetical protein QT06_C0001G1183 [archaeon GW2011_AR15]MBS3104347.1 hypothetical protein [Candidatus Woesearchaeota archaeon]HIH40869.1 hypothetical protein [Candidatus Woesearchaeota archaeon]
MPGFEQYNTERVKTFLKYLVHAAAKHKPERAVIRELREQREERLVPAIRKRPERLHIPGSAERLSVITDERKEELEVKIKMHHTRNRFLPYELRLKKLKKRYATIKRRKISTKADKRRLEVLNNRIERCESLLKELKANAHEY